MNTNLISVKNVGKRYGKREILSNIDLDICEGQSIAFTGRNGCGKSTLLRIIGGITRTTTGTVKHTGAVKIQYVPEHFPKIDLTPQEFMVYIGMLEGLSKEEAKERSIRLFEEFYMDEMVNVPMKHLSKGTLQKTAVIQALMIKPTVLLLDEPLSGQDMQAQKVFVEKMQSLVENGCAILMSCHEKWLIDAISQDIYMLQKGALHHAEYGG